MDKSSPSFWRSLNPGDQIVLTDAQSIEESMAAGQGATGLHLQIKKVISVKEMNGLCEWILLKTDAEDERFVLAKIVDEELDLRLYRPAPDFPIGDRVDMLDDGLDFLFEEFDEDTEPAKMRFTRDLEDPDGVTYVRKRFGELYGTVSVTPEESGVDNQMATVVEYSTDEDVPDTEALLMETGVTGNIVIEYDEEEDEETTTETEVISESRGGLIELFVGTPVRTNEVEVLTTKES